MTSSSAETAAVAADLLNHVRQRLGQPELGYAEAPYRLAGGRDMAVFALRFQGAPGDLAGPLVLRLFEESGARLAVGARRARFDAAVQGAVAAQGYPAPRPLLVGADDTVAGRHFLLMERLPGHPTSDDLVPPTRHTFGVGSLIAEMHARLHLLDPEPAREAIEAAGGTPADPLEGLAWSDVDLEEHGATALAPALRWLREHRPEPRRDVLCHSDFHPLNILVEGPRVTGVIDWSDLQFGEPAYDVASTVVLLTLAPVDLPRLLSPAFSAMRAALSAQYVRAYRRRRVVEDARLRYFEAAVITRRLLGALRGRQTGKHYAWDDPHTIDRLQRRLRGLSGAQVTLPEPAPALAASEA